jgi:hypothetical protein
MLDEPKVYRPFFGTAPTDVTLDEIYSMVDRLEL